jgi:phosphate transport system protein
VSEHEGVIVMVEHTIHAFDVDLQELARKIGEMGGLAEKQIMDAVEALVKHDITLAKRVIAADDQVDAQQREIEERAVVAIARRQPMAVDLRQIVGALRISNDLERIGDLAENIAKRGMMTDELPSNAAILQFDRMVKLVLVQLRRVLHSYAQHDVAEAIDVWHRDAEIDAMNSSLFRELLTYMMENPRNICFFAPRTSSEWAITPPISQKPFTISCKGTHSRANARRQTLPVKEYCHCPCNRTRVGRSGRVRETHRWKGQKKKAARISKRPKGRLGMVPAQLVVWKAYAAFRFTAEVLPVRRSVCSS